MAFLSKTLAKIDKNVPLELNMSECEFNGVKPDNSELYRVLSSLE